MRLEQESDGALSVDVYTDNVLGSERELLEGCQFGNYDIVLATNATVASFDHDIFCLDIPWLFDNKQQVYEVLDGPLGDRLGSQTVKFFLTHQNQIRGINMLCICIAFLYFAEFRLPCQLRPVVLSVNGTLLQSRKQFREGFKAACANLKDLAYEKVTNRDIVDMLYEEVDR